MQMFHKYNLNDIKVVPPKPFQIDIIQKTARCWFIYVQPLIVTRPLYAEQISGKIY